MGKLKKDTKDGLEQDSVSKVITDIVKEKTIVNDVPVFSKEVKKDVVKEDKEAIVEVEEVKKEEVVDITIPHCHNCGKLMIKIKDVINEKVYRCNDCNLTLAIQ